MTENSKETAEKSSPPATTAATTPRRHRYMRSSTAASVTQLLSDSCNSLLQRFRRNPSERLEKRTNRSDSLLFLCVFFFRIETCENVLFVFRKFSKYIIIRLTFT